MGRTATEQTRYEGLKVKEGVIQDATFITAISFTAAMKGLMNHADLKLKLGEIK